MSNRNASPARGSKDILPAEAQLRSWAISRITEIYLKHGFSQIETPIIENIGWLTGGIGGENEKLLFKILKRGEKLDLSNIGSEEDLCDLALRFDLTVPLTRYFANNRAKLPQPFKAIQIGPVFRAERPQKGRFRQFTQCDIDILGESSYLAEIELIGASLEALAALGLSGFEIKINDRRALEVLAGYCGIEAQAHQGFFITLDKLDKIGIDGVAAELVASGHSDSAIKKTVNFIEDLKSGKDPLESYSEIGVDGGLISDAERIVSFARSIAEGRFSVSIDPTVIRGMGYYTGTVFEISYPGWSSSIAGGGRYDKMLSRYGVDAPAVGFSLGFERIISILSENPDISSGTKRRHLTVLFEESEDLNSVYQQAQIWRDQGYSVSLRHKKAKLGPQLRKLESEADLTRGEGDFYGFVIFGQDQSPREL